jgi:hypothetical protein
MSSIQNNRMTNSSINFIGNVKFNPGSKVIIGDYINYNENNNNKEDKKDKKTKTIDICAIETLDDLCKTNFGESLVNQIYYHLNDNHGWETFLKDENLFDNDFTNKNIDNVTSDWNNYRIGNPAKFFITFFIKNNEKLKKMSVKTFILKLKAMDHDSLTVVVDDFEKFFNTKYLEQIRKNKEEYKKHTELKDHLRKILKDEEDVNLVFKILENESIKTLDHFEELQKNDLTNIGIPLGIVKKILEKK